MKKKLVNPIFIAALAVGMLCVFLITKALRDLKEEKEARIQQEEVARQKVEQENLELKAKLEAASKVSPTEAPKIQTKPVVCFKVPLQSRTEVNRVMVEMREYPIEMIPEGAFSEIKEVIGKYTVRSVDAKEPATASKVKSIREIGGMSYRITPGMRAIAVPVTPINSSGNLITDGDFVDILLSEKDKGGEFIRTRIFLQNIRILSFFASAETEQNAGLQKTAQDTATVEVSPEQAEGLIQARNMGEMSLVLRSVKDQKTVRTRGFEKSELASDLGVIQSRSKRTLNRLADEQKEELMKSQTEETQAETPKESDPKSPEVPSPDSTKEEKQETPQ